MARDGRSAVREFEAGELLYRRFLDEHYVDGFLTRAHFSFPEPNSETGGPSFARSRFCKPEHVAHANCGGKAPAGQWGILQCSATDPPSPIGCADERVFEFAAAHVPRDSCYAHSEIWCRPQDTEAPSRPPKNVREKFRLALSKKLSMYRSPKQTTDPVV